MKLEKKKQRAVVWEATTLLSFGVHSPLGSSLLASKISPKLCASLSRVLYGKPVRKRSRTKVRSNKEGKALLPYLFGGLVDDFVETATERITHRQRHNRKSKLIRKFARLRSKEERALALEAETNRKISISKKHQLERKLAKACASAKGLEVRNYIGYLRDRFFFKLCPVSKTEVVELRRHQFGHYYYSRFVGNKQLYSSADNEFSRQTVNKLARNRGRTIIGQFEASDYSFGNFFSAHDSVRPDVERLSRKAGTLWAKLYMENGIRMPKEAFVTRKCYFRRLAFESLVKSKARRRLAKWEERKTRAYLTKRVHRAKLARQGKRKALFLQREAHRNQAILEARERYLRRSAAISDRQRLNRNIEEGRGVIRADGSVDYSDATWQEYGARVSTDSESDGEDPYYPTAVASYGDYSGYHSDHGLYSYSSDSG